MAAWTYPESTDVGTDNVTTLDALAVLEQDEGGHGADRELGGDLAVVVDVKLEEGGLVGELDGELLNLGRDDLAGSCAGGRQRRARRRGNREGHVPHQVAKKSMTTSLVLDCSMAAA